MEDIIRFIGIDFGTSTSVVSYMDYRQTSNKLEPIGNIQNVEYSGGKSLIPTIIKKAAGKSPERCGNEVDELYLDIEPQYIEKEFKMALGMSVTQEERKKAIDLTHKFFEYLYRGYFEHERGQTSTIKERRVFVSYPAKWESHQKSITIEAAYEAFKKFPEVEVNKIYSLDEPTAALYYCLNQKDIENKVKEELRLNKPSYILLIDMGAGTTDLVLYKYIPNQNIKVLAKFPEPAKEAITFGGREVDKILKNYILNEYSKYLEDSTDASMLNECKKWKEMVSRFFSNSGEDIFNRLPSFVKKSPAPNLSKADICGILKDYLPKFLDLIYLTISMAENNCAEFKQQNTGPDFVILTGGHSQWFFVEEMLKGKWLPGLPGNENIGNGINLPRIKSENWRIIRTAHPQHIVSYGLCMSENPIKVIQLSNCQVWLDMQLGNSITRRELILKKGIQLPVKKTFTNRYLCRINGEDTSIPIKMTPIIGANANDFLESLETYVDTNLIRDIKHGIIEYLIGPTLREEPLELNLTCEFDANQLFSFQGTITTPGTFGFTSPIKMSPIEIAQTIRQSMD